MEEVLKRAGCQDVSEYNISKFQKLVEEYPFSFEAYYHTIEKFTFPTKFVELDLDTLQALVKQYQHTVLSKPAPTESQLGLLAQLEVKIDREIKSLGPNVGAFVRLSRRSPKDSLLDCEMCRKRVLDMLCEKLKNMDPSDNEKELKVALECIVKGMRVANGKEAMELIINSERVYHDLLLADCFPTAQLAEGGKFFVNIIIREWRDIPVESEFRAFVYNRALTAILQYCDMLYFGKPFVESKPKYEKLIREKFAEVQNALPIDSCIIDFAVLYDGSTYIIELNPFKTTTGGSLFDWQYDKQILENSQNSQNSENSEKTLFEFRMIEEPIVYEEGMVSGEWVKLIQAARDKIVSTRKEKNCIIM